MQQLVKSVSGSTLKYDSLDDAEINVYKLNICQISGDRGQRLLRKTLANHFKTEYWDLITKDGFFFCPNKACPVIYFNNQTKSYLGEDAVHTTVMHKMEIGIENRPACYCKNVTEKQILDELLVKQCCDSLIDIQEFTEANTGKDCAITNPTGRCCGKQIREILEWTKDRRLEISVPLMNEAMSCCMAIEENSKENID